jgi:hypothetical protein
MVFLEERICSQSRNQVHDKVVHGAMTGMLYLTDVFQFIIDCFDNRTFAKHYSVIKAHQTVFHIAFDTCYQMNAIIEKHLKKRRRNISFITKKFSE